MLLVFLEGRGGYIGLGLMMVTRYLERTCGDVWRGGCVDVVESLAGILSCLFGAV
jgi:hypothetical protein